MTDLKQVNDDLENWRNCYKDRKSQRVTRSLEGRYRPSRKDIDYEETAPPPPTKPINVSLASKYEQQVCLLPFKNKYCLAIEYMYPWALGERYFTKTRKKCGIGGKNEWDLLVKNAKLMLINRMR
jgi:hypothetical protein